MTKREIEELKQFITDEFKVRDLRMDRLEAGLDTLRDDMMTRFDAIAEIFENFMDYSEGTYIKKPRWFRAKTKAL